MSDERSGICVYSERPDVVLELLAPACDLARAGRLEISTVSIGNHDAAEPLAHGAGRVLQIEGVSPQGDAASHAAALGRAVARLRPSIVLIGATIHGTEVAARLAQDLGVGCASECLSIEAAGDEVTVERNCLGGFVTRQSFVKRPAIATIRPGRHDPPPRLARATGDTERLRLDTTANGTRVLATEPRRRSRVELDRAATIVCVGRGLAKRDDLPLVEQLAAALGGALAATRPLTDDLGWLPVDLKVGLSGQTVKPRLYIACGVSGQIEHVVGMRSSGTVVAINRDPRAPIMEHADYRIVGDLYELIPALVRALESGPS